MENEIKMWMPIKERENQIKLIQEQNKILYYCVFRNISIKEYYDMIYNKPLESEDGNNI